MKSTIEQIQLTQYGSAEVLQLVQEKMPVPTAGEVLIRVEASGVNYSDILRRTNNYYLPTPLPFVLGAEAVGEVVAVGSASQTPIEAGSRVLAILPDGGGYAEYIIAKAEYCIPLPPHIDSREATALFVQGSTAHLMLTHTLGDVKGKTLLIHAAAGGVGSLLVQLAKMMGAKVIATASTSEKLAYARELGADVVVNYSAPNWTEELIQANQHQQVDIVLECIGGSIYTQSFACLKPFGTMVVFGAASGEPGTSPSVQFVDGSHQLKGFNLGHIIGYEPEVWQNSLRSMIGLLAEGKIRVKTPNSYPLAEAAQAHQDLENRKTSGKVVLIP